MEFQRKLKVILEAQFQSAEASLETTSTGRVGGFVVSPGFSGMAHVERQNLLWKHLKSVLNQEELLGIVSILTLTPEEVKEAS